MVNQRLELRATKTRTMGLGRLIVYIISDLLVWWDLTTNCPAVWPAERGLAKVPSVAGHNLTITGWSVLSALNKQK